ncbi:hypothetical protein VTN00DRAFT_4082 [Thermoascus crustaceus]|uniref:uncharacterized protein n=1 Tax=Thermoascus crustaceus TaxID=5088 RepID=UPI003742F126
MISNTVFHTSLKRFWSFLLLNSSLYFTSGSLSCTAKALRFSLLHKYLAPGAPLVPDIGQVFRAGDGLDSTGDPVCCNFCYS